MLTLPIKKQWYDEILSGKKKIEYREIKPYWTSRFLKVTGIQGEADESVFSLKEKFNNQDKRFDVLIRNGYEPDSPFFVAECRIDIGGSGAYWNDWYYRLHILRIKEKPTEQDNRNKATEKKGIGPMRIIDNINTILRDDLKETIRPKSKVSIAAACFSMYAYNVLKKQLESVNELRFIFTSPI